MICANRIIFLNSSRKSLNHKPFPGDMKVFAQLGKTQSAQRNFSRKMRWLLSIFLILPIPLSARQPEVKFDCLTLEQGLSQTTVLAIAQDQTGFLWFGTVDGLNRFDGYDFTVYENNPLDITSISDDWILSLLVTRDGTLWAGTLRGELNRFHPADGSFTHYDLKPVAEKTNVDRNLLEQLPAIFSFLQASSIKTIFEDHDSTIWLGTFGAGLFTFDRAGGQINTCNWYNNSLVDDCQNIMSICETHNENGHVLWIGTFGGGLIKITDRKIAKIYRANQQNSVSDNRICALTVDSLAGEPGIWVGTLGGGLNLFEFQKEKFTHFRHDSRKSTSIAEDRILAVIRNEPDYLWLGTQNCGLDRLQISRREFTHFQHDPTKPTSLASNTILSLCKDQTGILWIGTDLGHGIHKVDQRRLKFRHIAQHQPQNASLSDNVIFSIYEDSNRELWIGTFKGGVTKFNAQRNKVVNYRHDPTNPNSISDDHIRCFFEDREGIMWIGTFSGGLNRFNPRTQRFTCFRHHPDDPTSISSNQVRAIFEDYLGRMWIGTFGGGLNLFNRESGKFRHFRHDRSNRNSLSDDRIYTILEQPNGVLWLSTFDGGIVKFEVGPERFTRYLRAPLKPNSLNENRVFCLLPDPHLPEVLWAGTSGGGLNRFDTHAEKFTCYTQKNGLPNDVVYGILSDDEGCLWMSTNKGIAKFDPATESFTNYDQTDGLQSNEFNSGAFFRSNRGELFFGGINGFNCFFPENININEHVPPVVITSFKIFDTDQSELLPATTKTKQINLSYKDNFFSFEFSALDFTRLGKNQYIYQLEGLNDNWIHCGTRRFVNFTNLDPGDYVFHVKGANSDGIWNEEGARVKLKIIPPFWETWWFYLSAVWITFVSIFGLYRYRLRINVKREVELERVRLFENERVRKMIAADFHDELGQKLTRISLFSEILKRKLSAAAPENLDYIEKISGVATELSRSTRDFIWTLDPGQDSLYDIALYLKDFGDEIFDKTGITFRVDGISRTLEKTKLPVKSRRHLTLIIKEAMNNILKHAQARNVLFRIQVETSGFKISVQDDGIGYEQKTPSSGRGLSNMQQRATLIESELHIISKIGNGTTIEVVCEIPQTGY